MMEERFLVFGLRIFFAAGRLHVRVIRFPVLVAEHGIKDRQERLVLRTANTAPVWRGGMRCFSTRFAGKNWLHISAELY
jgi:hypothetical protein